MTLSDLNVDLTVPWDIPGHSNLVQLLVQSHPGPTPQGDLSLERTERTERTTGRHGPPGAAWPLPPVVEDWTLLPAQSSGPLPQRTL